MKVIIMRGAPGSGKSYWIANNAPEAAVCSADNYFKINGEYRFDPARLPNAHDQCLKHFLKIAYAGRIEIVVDNTNTKVFEIAPYYRTAEVYGYDVEIVWMIAPPEKCKERNTHNVPPHVIDSMISGVEALPSWWKVRVVLNP